MAALPAVISGLVALFDAAVTVPVYDGPTVTGDRPTSYVMVGDPEDESASLTLELSSLGPGIWQDEAGEVTCSVAVGTGDVDVVTARTTAFDLFEQLRDAVNADRTVGGALTLNPLGQIGRASLLQQQTTEGVVVVVSFAVPYRTTLTA